MFCSNRGPEQLFAKPKNTVDQRTLLPYIYPIISSLGVKLFAFACLFDTFDIYIFESLPCIMRSNKATGLFPDKSKTLPVLPEFSQRPNILFRSIGNQQMFAIDRTQYRTGG